MSFNSVQLKQFNEKWNFIINTPSPNYPKSNGFADKSVRIAKQLKKNDEVKN